MLGTSPLLGHALDNAWEKPLLRTGPLLENIIFWLTIWHLVYKHIEGLVRLYYEYLHIPYMTVYVSKFERVATPSMGRRGSAWLIEWL